jgi:hypothetical protein
MLENLLRDHAVGVFVMILLQSSDDSVLIRAIEVWN